MLTTYKTTLFEKKQLANDVFLFCFNLIEPKEFNFKAGQYLILKIGEKSRLYSIASPSFKKDSFELIVHLMPGGVASTYLSNLKIGDEVLFEGPAGVFTLKDNNQDKIFLATGCGIAPVRSILLSTLDTRKASNHFYLFWGLKTYKDIYLFDELKKFSQTNPNFKFFICLSREQNLDMVVEEDIKYFILGHINDSLEEVIKEKNPNYSITQLLNYFDYYLCGSREVVETSKQYLLEKGVRRQNMIYEKF